MDNDKKAELIDILTHSCWSLLCVSNGDDSYRWVVVGSYMAKPYERVLGESFDEDNPYLAIQDAIKTTKDSCYDYKYDASILD